MLTITATNIKDNFEYDPIHSLGDDEPTFKGIQKAKNDLKANAMTVETALGSGTFGFLGLVLSDQEYALIISQVAFQRPQNPGDLTLQQGVTQVQARNLEATHERCVKEYQTCKAMDRALKNQLIEAVGEAWLEPLRNTQTNTINHTIPEILAFLFVNYGDVSPDSLEERAEKVKKMTYMTQHSLPLELFMWLWTNWLTLAQPCAHPIPSPRLLILRIPSSNVQDASEEPSRNGIISSRPTLTIVPGLVTSNLTSALPTRN